MTRSKGWKYPENVTWEPFQTVRKDVLDLVWDMARSSEKSQEKKKNLIIHYQCPSDKRPWGAVGYNFCPTQ